MITYLFPKTNLFVYKRNEQEKEVWQIWMILENLSYNRMFLNRKKKRKYVMSEIYLSLQKIIFVVKLS